MNGSVLAAYRRYALAVLFPLVLVLLLLAFGEPAPAEAAFPGVNGKIVFQSERDGNSELYVMNADGSGQTRLTSVPEADTHPAWSPDGTRIAFESLRDGNIEIYVMNADGSAPTRLTDNAWADTDPAWSPDGSLLAFVSLRDGNSDIYVMNAADGSDQANLTRHRAQDGLPAWSPNGQRIAFNSDRGGKMQDIYVINADGSGVVRLTDAPGWDWDPEWSPDGKRIAYNKGHAFHDNYNQDIWVMNADGTGQTNLTNNPAVDYGAAWSPNGRRIAFVSNRTGDEDIYAMSPNGRNQINLSQHGGLNRSPGWQPSPFQMYVSLAGSGSIGGVAFTPADILKYDTRSGWSMVFDASDVGVTRNIVAFEMMDAGSAERADDFSFLMAFSSNQPVTGVGTFTPQDVARFLPTSLGPATAGTFEWAIDGSAVGLTTLGEKIDALGETTLHRLAISTTGTATVPGPGGAVLRAQDEDALSFEPRTGQWWPFFNGTPVPGLADEDIAALWSDQLTEDLYVSLTGIFNLGGVIGNGKDIVKLSSDGTGGYTPSLFWDGSDNGLRVPIDALEMVLGLPPALAWPIDCVPGDTCAGMGYPDIDADGRAFNCGSPGYTGHSGTDIGVTWEQMDQGVPVYAAADGVVLWTREGEFDRCPGPHPDCQAGHYFCFGPGYFCGTGTCCCTWCFTGNLVVIRHTGLAGVFATTYGHLRNGSLLVTSGQTVHKGQQIAQVGSSGNSSGPHLHFDVWGTGFWEPADPWAGACGPNFDNPLWQYDPPWGQGVAPIYGLEDAPPRYDWPLPGDPSSQCPQPAARLDD